MWFSPKLRPGLPSRAQQAFEEHCKCRPSPHQGLLILNSVLSLRRWILEKNVKKYLLDICFAWPDLSRCWTCTLTLRSTTSSRGWRPALSSSSCSCAGDGDPDDDDHDEFATAGDDHDEVVAGDDSSCLCAGWSSTGSLIRFQRSPR